MVARAEIRVEGYREEYGAKWLDLSQAKGGRISLRAEGSDGGFVFLEKGLVASTQHTEQIAQVAEPGDFVSTITLRPEFVVHIPRR